MGVRVVFSGIQPTGVPHIGNYFGALMQWKRLQDCKKAASLLPASAPVKESPGLEVLDEKCELFFSVVDLHSLTAPWNPAALRQARKEAMAALLAIGLETKHCSLFYQSQVPQHAELAWILQTISSIGYLSRMTQWKQKSAQMDTNNNYSKHFSLPSQESGNSAKLGLFAYPVLMAADILLYKTTHVPVGDDQLQHLELARMLARQFNRATESNLFVQPKAMLSDCSRIMNLKNPLEKMSKSATTAATRILLTDSSQDITNKVKGAYTDSDKTVEYNQSQKPGVANLLEIMSAVRGIAVQDVADEFIGSTHKTLKEQLSKELIDHLKPIRDKYYELLESQEMEEASLDGLNKAKTRVQDTMSKVTQLVGL